MFDINTLEYCIIIALQQFDQMSSRWKLQICRVLKIQSLTIRDNSLTIREIL